MKKILLTLNFLWVIMCYSQLPSNDPHWGVPIWQDEFDFFDASKWSKGDHCDHFGEPQLYMPENVYVENGNLVLKIDNNSAECPENQQGTLDCGGCVPGMHMFTSGWVESFPYFKFKYGCIEAQIKFPRDFGLWPAFWLDNADSPSENHSEVDICEYISDWWWNPIFKNNSNYNYITTTNVHLWVPGELDRVSPIWLSSPIDEWHKYAIEWSPSRIIWYIDGFPVRSLPNPGVIQNDRIILNVALLRKENRDPDDDYVTFPAYMYVNYVRVYKLNEDCNDFINTTNYNFSMYNNVEKNFINIGEGGGNNSLSIGENKILRASNYLKLSGIFTVPIGASFYMDANGDCSNPINSNCTLTFNPCTFNFATYDNTVKKTIELGGNNCSVSITPTSSNVLLYATDKIILHPNTTISTNLNLPNKLIELKPVICN